jgi:rubrerythrin
MQGLPKEEVTYTYSCDDCFITWEAEEKELVCPVCGSVDIYLEERRKVETNNSL